MGSKILKDMVYELEKRVNTIEQYVVEKNSTDIFENMTFLIGMMKQFDSSMGRVVEQSKMMQGELQLRAMFMAEKKIDEEFQEWVEKRKKEMEENQKDDQENKLAEQKKKLEELEGGN